jgi:DNA-binding response OmpR family regulator
MRAYSTAPYPFLMSIPMRTVLVIDDDPAVSCLLEGVLKTVFRVRTAGGVLEGMFILDREPIDLLLLDVGLPGLSGFDLYQRLKSDNHLRHTPVLFLSGRGDVKDELAELGMPDADCLPKPFRIADLLARARAAIR